MLFEIVTNSNIGLTILRSGLPKGFIVRRNSHADFIGMIIATVVAATGLIGLLHVNHGLLNVPKVHNETMIQYGSAAAAAASAGATVTATAPPQELLVVVPAPKPAVR
jgi:hypothetical protein